MDRDSAILELDRLGLPVPDDLKKDISRLILGEYEKGQEDVVLSLKDADEDLPMYDGRRHLWLYDHPPVAEDNPDIVNDPIYWQRVPEEWKKKWKNRTITPKDWIPKGCPEEIPKEVFDFILSANPRFDKLVAYEPFYVYCEFARRMSDREETAESFVENSEEWVDFTMSEVHFSRINHLYALDRYAWIKDDSHPGGRRKYRASAPQALLCWLKNIGVNYVLAKGRQAAITSTEMACAAIRVRCIPSYKGVLVTDDKEETGKSIFGEKFSFTGTSLPEWLQPKTVLHDSTLMIMYGFSGSNEKGKRKKLTTEFSVFGSKDTQAINGTSPTDLYGDEAQNVATIDAILRERRPTSWASVNGKMRLIRQSFIWGTASSHDKGKGAFEGRYRDVKSKMMRGQNTGGWVAVFFDAFCRPYMTKDMYFREYKEEYMSNNDESAYKGLSREERLAMFSSHYPMSDEDAFRGPANSAVDGTVIKSHIDRILKFYPQGATRGYFVPEYDLAAPQAEGSRFPYAVLRSSFKRAVDGDLSAPVSMLCDHEEGWVDNYCQGTDPFAAYTGMSRMSSVIMAKAAAVRDLGNGKHEYVAAPVCWIDYVRSKDPHESFMQTKLMGMYYHNFGERACPELVEVEQGHSYIEFVQGPIMKCGDSLVTRGQLPIGYNIGNHPWGMAMKEGTKTLAYADLQRMISVMGHNIWSYTFYQQCKTIEHDENNKGSVKWGTKDVRRFNDDLVVAHVICFINMVHVHGSIQPRRIGVDEPEEEESMEFIRDASGIGSWKKVMVRKYDDVLETAPHVYR